MGELVQNVKQADSTKDSLAKEISIATREERYLFWQLNQIDKIVYEEGSDKPPFNPSLLFIVKSHAEIEVDWVFDVVEGEYEVHRLAGMDLTVPDTIMVSETEQHKQADKYLRSLLARIVCFECTRTSRIALVVQMKEALVISRTEAFMEILRPKIIYASRRNVAKV